MSDLTKSLLNIIHNFTLRSVQSVCCIIRPFTLRFEVISAFEHPRFEVLTAVNLPIMVFRHPIYPFCRCHILSFIKFLKCIILLIQFWTFIKFSMRGIRQQLLVELESWSHRSFITPTYMNQTCCLIVSTVLCIHVVPASILATEVDCPNCFFVFLTYPVQMLLLSLK